MADEKAGLTVSAMAQVAMSESVQAFWTEERKAAATPRFIEVGPETRALLESAQAAVAMFAAPPSELASTPPGGPGAVSAAVDPQPGAPAAGSLTELVPDRDRAPYCTVGKLFMTFNGEDFVGSAWVIAESGVFTAGHCVYDAGAGGFADKLLFVPQYDDGAAPVGQWTFSQIACLNGWAANGEDMFAYDLAAFKTERAIRPSTGSLGWMAHHPVDQGPYTGIGYPAGHSPNHPFDGSDMWRSTGAFRGHAGGVTQMYNDMTGGCSGGPWAVWREGGVYANGLNSFRYNDDPASMYSPYFGEGFLNLYNWVK